MKHKVGRLCAAEGVIEVEIIGNPVVDVLKKSSITKYNQHWKTEGLLGYLSSMKLKVGRLCGAEF